MRLIIVLVALICTSSCFAFSWKKCSSQGLGSMNIFGITTSTGQFLTSTGGCAMIGMAAHDKKVFIAQNFEHVQSDSARGGGEYLSAYASLSGCSEIASHRLGIVLQKNFTNVFGHRLEHSPKQAYERIEKVIVNDSELKASCKLPRV